MYMYNLLVDNTNCWIIKFKFTVHRRRKILKVGGAEYPIVRKVCTKNLRPRPLHVQPRPFLHDRGCYHEFLDEKINCKLSRIDLAATEAHLLMIRPGKCLKICVVTILGWRTMGALPPFLEYWGATRNNTVPLFPLRLWDSVPPTHGQSSHEL